jgi:gluconokinase
MTTDLPPVVMLMGVAGCGKTTVGELLASRLGWPYADADAFHSPANVAKMAAGRPLTDEDRWPWLAAIAGWIDERRAAGQPAVLSCSGLKRAYRDFLRRDRPQLRPVLLTGSRDLIASRLRGRHGHFMREAMLDSQLADLEPPGPDEPTVVVPIEGSPAEVADRVLRALRLAPPDAPAG